MKICKRALDFIQIVSPSGAVRVCSWLNEKGNGGLVGNLMENSLPEIYKGGQLRKIQEQFCNGDYSVCNADACKYLRTDSMDEISVDIEELPDYPSSLYLAYECLCNYKCTVCSSHQSISNCTKKNWEKNYEIIDNRVREVLPFVKHIGAHGKGELFCSKHIMQLLSEWQPISAPEDCSAALESNGSLFNEKNWSKISNLGKYNLTVVITVMSFNELTYQYLSGTHLPVSNVIENLRFISDLRKKGVVNNFIIKNIVQERNFMELPDFVRFCLSEFEMDTIMPLPVIPWGASNPNIRWFEDVRNPYHPYHGQFIKILEDPIFNNPKVWLSSDFSSVHRDSPYGEHPGIRMDRVTNAISNIEDFVDYTKKVMDNKSCKRISLYGFARTSKLLMKLWNDEIDIYQIFDNDRRKMGKEYHGVNILSPHDGAYGDDVLVIITPLAQGEVLKKEILSYGNKNVVTIEEFLGIKTYQI